MHKSLRNSLAIGTLLTAFASTPALAFDSNTFSSALGGGIGGALGAAVGNEIGGSTGALIGSAVGAAGGTLITKRNDDEGYDNRYDDRRGYDDRGYNNRYSGYRYGR
ncbi:glycine zipper domain-containing protein [Salinisphaera aquimarina]|uniref:Glycine zipper domain-containing protein n=1 Tax=Salinisphaera aquimarina TaxID=2094031 RepID=A0ABV7EK90_9GAMM